MARRVMVKWLGLLLVFLPLRITSAQDVVMQPPIIAEYDDIWYAVSPVDGSAALLLEPEEGKLLLALRNNFISPDHRWLAYVQYTPMNLATTDKPYELWLLNIETGDREMINPVGGVFDRPTPPNHVFRISLPTWSNDGSRLYYLREEYDTRDGLTIVGLQLAYYDLADSSHHLTSRVDPSRVVDDLSPVQNGMILRTVKGGSDIDHLTYYNADGSVINDSQLVYTHQSPVMLGDETYYVELDEQGQITAMMGAESEAYTPITQLYFPANRSKIAGDASLRVFRYFGGGVYYAVYSADHETLINVFNSKRGSQHAISPDGQAVAFVLYDKPGEGAIHIVQADGTTRELPFRANLIVWGAMESEAFAVLDSSFSLNG